MKEEKREKARQKEEAKGKKGSKKTAPDVDPCDAEVLDSDEDASDDSEQIRRRPASKAKAKAKGKAKARGKAKAKAKGKSKRKQEPEEDAEEEEAEAFDDDENLPDEAPAAKPARRKKGKQADTEGVAASQAKRARIPDKSSHDWEDYLDEAMQREIHEAIQGVEGMTFPQLSKKIKEDKADFNVCCMEYYWTRPAVGVREVHGPKKELAYFAFGRDKFNYSMAAAAACANMLAPNLVFWHFNCWF